MFGSRQVACDVTGPGFEKLGCKKFPIAQSEAEKDGSSTIMCSRPPPPIEEEPGEKGGVNLMAGAP